MQGHFLFLGTGGSAGVPLIGCRCAVCSSSSAFNKRLRSAGLVIAQDKQYLIDVGPDFREMALKYRIDHLEGVLITHAHADHIAGIDDLKAYYFASKQKLACLLSAETYQELKQRFPYLFQKSESISAQLDFRILPADFGRTSFESIEVGYVSYHQLKTKVTGFRIGNFAYVSDIRTYSPEVIAHLKGVEILVVSALRHVPNQMHFSLEEAIAFSQNIQAQSTYFTHIAHDLDHESVDSMLPKGFRLSYDGLKIPIEL